MIHTSLFSFLFSLFSLFLFSLFSFLFPLSSFLFPLSSFLFPLSSFLFPLSSFLFPLSSFLFPLSSFLFPLSSFLFPLSSFLFPLSSFLFPLSSFLFPLSSFLFPLSSFLFPLSSFLFLFLYSILLYSSADTELVSTSQPCWSTRVLAPRCLPAPVRRRSLDPVPPKRAVRRELKRTRTTPTKPSQDSSLNTELCLALSTGKGHDQHCSRQLPSLKAQLCSQTQTLHTALLLRIANWRHSELQNTWCGNGVQTHSKTAR